MLANLRFVANDDPEIREFLTKKDKQKHKKVRHPYAGMLLNFRFSIIIITLNLARSAYALHVITMVQCMYIVGKCAGVFCNAEENTLLDLW